VEQPEGCGESVVTSGIGHHNCAKDSESDSSTLMNGRALPGFPFFALFLFVKMAQY
jgi:hypothetical protein